MKLIEWTMEEQEQLIHFMTRNAWPYHVNSHPGRELIEKAIDEGGYESDEVKTFWLESDEGEKVGMVKIYDLHDEIPLFDLRIAEKWRGLGHGTVALKLVSDYVFRMPEKKIRLEGHTRQDNFPMRKTFERAGFLKEAHLRQAWFVPKEYAYYDAVTYGITREDFLEGKTTPVSWDDEKVKEEVRFVKNWEFANTFDSERLIIRMPHMEDAEAVWDAIMQSADSLKPYMPWAQTLPKSEETRENIRQAIADFMARKDLRLHMFLKETGEFIGSSGLHRIDWAIPKFEIGYWLDVRHEGKGYMTEAVERISQFAFEELHAARIEIRCDSDNIRSRAVAERAQYELEGIFRNDSLSADGKALRDTCIYAKTQ
ncbi:GNAT family N-acetyltransferase [Viridibacillus sp. YIM B01967]|uniref:GNAT family N-acetyltransferase n=1 Tax=Viridibacillus soli TaxID=2798301 RepID=A0ABS1H574_9BACL|nr:GNAT family N-acetyltransferase [Viridibacillus soli]MBK3494551.1 GNAT family N-acetyltransferase [Viridibacillus soli]